MVRVVAGLRSPPVAATTLLVTSHRPLETGVASVAAAGLAPAGEAVAAGHPSLAADLQGLLGAGWRVRALFDLRPEDLQAVGPGAAGGI